MSSMIKKCVFFLAIAALLLPAIAAHAQIDAVSFEEQRISVALRGEPPNLNGTEATDADSMMVLGHVMEGLLRHGKRKLEPGVAEKWEMTPEGATFWLRKDAKWSDGKPVTAHDFVFAWRKAADPKTASEYAFIMYVLKNGEAVSIGEKDVTELGVTAVDDYTLKVDFERPCGYFESLTAFVTYYPIREDFYNSRGDRYAADAGDLLFNGPFKLTDWVHGASLRMEKNEHYWNKDGITLNVIDIPYITPDTRARFNLYKDGKIILTRLDSETLSSATKERYKIRKFSDGSVFYLEFNHQRDVPGNLNFRKAIQAVFDPQVFVDKVIALPGNLPGYSLFPVYLKGVDDDFRKEYPAKKAKVDVGQAKEYLEKAKQELGIAEIPPLVLLSGDTPSASKQAEYLQGLLKETLGLEIKLDKQIFKQRLAKMTAGDFDIVAAGWGPDYDDPLTFADLFASWNENNRGKYVNSEYDELIKTAVNSVDPKARMDAMGKCQDIIFGDVAILPQYERGLTYVTQSKNVKGIVRRVIGADPDYTHARVVQPK